MAQLDEAAPLHITVEQQPIGPVIYLAGELDASNAGRVWDTLTPVLHDHPACLAFDLSGLTFMDSGGIAVLVRAHRAAGTTKMVNPSAQARRIIELTGLADILGMHP